MYKKVISDVLKNSDLDLEELLNKDVYVSSKTYTSTAHRIYLDDGITSPKHYRKALEVLEDSGPDDFVTIHIDSYGGQICTAIKLINAIRTCEASVLGVLEQRAYSAGSLILLACPSIAVKPYATFMAHSGQAGAYGEFAKSVDQLQFFNEETTRLMFEMYEGFLTEDEITDVTEGKREIWLRDYEITERLEQFAVFKQEQQAALMAAMQELEESPPKPARKRVNKTKSKE